MSAEMSERTVGGLLAYCDWLRDKGYQGPNAVDAWKTAVKKVFAAVEPDAYEALSLENLDVEDYIRRFRTLVGAQYKAETVAVYQRRLTNAIEAHAYYIANGKPPVFRAGQRTKNAAEAVATSKKPAKSPGAGERLAAKPRLAVPETVPERYEFSYPMSYGMAHISLPIRMTKRDIERLATVLGTLEEQPQIPERTGRVAA